SDSDCRAPDASSVSTQRVGTVASSHRYEDATAVRLGVDRVQARTDRASALAIDPTEFVRHGHGDLADAAARTEATQVGLAVRRGSGLSKLLGRAEAEARRP